MAVTGSAERRSCQGRGEVAPLDSRSRAALFGSCRRSQFRTYSLISGATQKIWNELTNDSITQVDVWEGYRAHVKHRQVVVHGGALVNDAVASRSLEVVQRMIEHVERLAVS